jgi:hypothetical protein
LPPPDGSLRRFPPAPRLGMSEQPAKTTLLAEIESRQDELLRQLDELEKKIARVLADYAASCQPKQGGVLAAEAVAAGQTPVPVENRASRAA